MRIGEVNENPAGEPAKVWRCEERQFTAEGQLIKFSYASARSLFIIDYKYAK